MNDAEVADFLRQNRWLCDLSAPLRANLLAGQAPQVAHAEPLAEVLEAHSGDVHGRQIEGILAGTRSGVVS